MIKPVCIALMGIAIVVGSCGEPQSEIIVKHEKKRKDLVLGESDIFETVKILAFLQNETKFIEEANKLFLMGLNSFRNNKDLDSADHYFRQSIIKEPSGKAYFELGNVYMDRKDYNGALEAFELAEHLDFQPFSKVLYNKSCLYSLKKEPEKSAQYLEYALQAGYNNLDHITKDKDLEELRKTHHYDQAMNRGMRGMSNPENLFWLQFKKLFPKHTLPHKLNAVMDAKDVHDLTYVSYEFEKYISEMRDEKFSREVSQGFYHYSQPYETEKFVAIVYIVREEFLGEYAPVQYRMATFTHEGKLIDKRTIGGRENLDDYLLDAALNEDRTISVNLMEPTYEKDPDEHGYWENPIVSREKVGTMKFKVSGSGKIQLVSGQEFDNLSASNKATE